MLGVGAAGTQHAISRFAFGVACVQRMGVQHRQGDWGGTLQQGPQAVEAVGGHPLRALFNGAQRRCAPTEIADCQVCHYRGATAGRPYPARRPFQARVRSLSLLAKP